MTQNDIVKSPTKADKDFYTAIRDILREQQLSKQARPVYQDGTTANSFYINGYFNTYDLTKGEFPITTLRPIAWKSAIKEILWIYQMASNNLDDLNELGVKYWDAWEVDNTREIGKRYGYLVRKHDIINKLLKQLEENPWNRRNVISLWDYEAFEESEGLLPCAFLTMFDVRTDDEDNIYLDCTLIQRSNDMLVAHHINAIQYVALQLMIACHFGWKVGKFNYFVNNLHIYDNQLEQAEEILIRYEQLEEDYLESVSKEITNKILKERKDLFEEEDEANSFMNRIECVNNLVKMQVSAKIESNIYSSEMPQLKLTCPDKTNFFDISIDDFELINYDPIKPQIKFRDLAI